MKILKIFGAVVAVHAAVFIFAFVMPGCRSSARTSSTPPPDASQLPPTAGAYGSANYQASGNPYDGSGVNTPVPSSASGPVSATPSYSDFGVAPSAPLSGFGTPAPAQPLYQPTEVTGVVPLSSYTVVSGDSLWTISRKKGVSVDEIKAANNLKSNNLKVGQKLLIPAKQPAGSATASAAGTGGAAVGSAPASATSTYTVVAG
ncbi:LysM peptidoglycan-binding domain-containing protein, partial [Termitidicoccus mucosus]